MLNQADKDTLWNLLVVQKPQPRGVTETRLKKIRPVLDNWTFFWQDLESHLGNVPVQNLKLESMEPSTRSHLVGNFWGMVVEALYKSGLLKP